MTNESHLRVFEFPPNQKPLMIWDGECHFLASGGSNVWRENPPLAKWIMPHLSRGSSRGSQKFRSKQFKHAVAFIEPDGKPSLPAEGRVSLVEISILEEVADVELRSRFLGFAGHFRDRLQISSRRNRGLGSTFTRLLWGKDVAGRRLIFWARRWFSSHAWTHLSDRLRVSLGASGWTCWQQRNVARKSVFSLRFGSNLGQGRLFFSCQHFAGSTRATPFYISFAVAALFFFRCFLIFGNRAGAFYSFALFVLLPVAHDRWDKCFSIFNGMFSLLETGFLCDFHCAMATMGHGDLLLWPGSSTAATASPVSRGGFVFAQIPSSSN